MKKYYITIGIFAAIIAVIQACSKMEPATPKEDSLLDGPVEGLNYEQSQRFRSGDQTFNDEIFTVEKGLGLIFVATSCEVAMQAMERASIHHADPLWPDR